jgi:hypothetical protein
MTTSIIRAGGTGVPGVQTTGGDDGALALKVGPLAATVEALNISSTGTGAFVGQVTATGFTGTLDGILGSGTPAAATVTTFTSNGIDDNADAVAITINSSEQVGIGTTSPSATLHVESANVVDGNNNGNVNILTSTAQAVNVGGKLDLGGFYDGSNKNSFAAVAGRKENSTSGNWSGYMQFSTRLFGASFAERMRITSAGNVGIGTATIESGFKLHVTGNGFFSPSSGTVGKVVVDNVDQRLVLGSYYEAGIGQNSFISSTNNAETGNLALAFRTGTTERMRIDASGNVGIGTSSPASILDLNTVTASGVHVPISLSANNSNAAKTNYTQIGFGISQGLAGSETGGFELKALRNNSSVYLAQYAGAAGAATWKFYTEGTERMRIDTNGNVGIGAAGAASIRLTLTAASDASPYQLRLGHTGNSYDIGRNASSGLLAFYGTQSGYNGYIFGGVNGERMRIDANGDVMVNRTTIGSSGQYSADFPGTTRRGASYNNTESFNGSNFVSFVDEGAVVGTIVQNSASTVNYATSSDYRLKENVIYDWDATTRLKQLKPARFNFITDDATVDGFLAHEAATVVPEAVTGTKDEVDDEGKPVMQGIDQSKLVPLLVKTILELEARITALEG